MDKIETLASVDILPASGPEMASEATPGIGNFAVLACQWIGDSLGVSPQAVSSALV